jgi:hypothetical protein
LTGQEAADAATKLRGDLEAAAKLGHKIPEAATDMPTYSTYWGHPHEIYSEEVRPL